MSHLLDYAVIPKGLWHHTPMVLNEGSNGITSNVPKFSKQKMSLSDFIYLKVINDNQCFEIHANSEEQEIILAGEFSSFFCLQKI